MDLTFFKRKFFGNYCYVLDRMCLRIKYKLFGSKSIKLGFVHSNLQIFSNHFQLVLFKYYSVPPPPPPSSIPLIPHTVTSTADYHYH